MKRFATAAVLVALAASPALAQNQDLDAGLARMAQTTGQDYLAARAKVVSLGEPARVELERRLKAASWTDQTFDGLAMAAIAHAHLANPKGVAAANALEGLDSRRYSLRRRPDPECGRELRRLVKQDAGVAPALLELELRTFASYPFTSPKTRPDLAAAEVERLAPLERQALREGIVIGLAESKHPAALFVLKRVARDAQATEGTRLQAAEGLGTLATDASFAELSSLVADAATPIAIRHAGLRGVARVPTRAAFDLLAARLQATDGDERRQAVVALGAFGSAWAWEARGGDTGDALRRDASAKLVDAIERGGLGVDDEALVSSIAMIAHPSAKPLLEKAKADATKPEATRALAGKALDRLSMQLERKAK